MKFFVLAAGWCLKQQGRFYRLSQQQWNELKGCLHRRKGRKGFAPKGANRQAFEAVLSRERAGCPRRDAPVFDGDWHTIHLRWQRRVEAGGPRKAMGVRSLAAVKTGELDRSSALPDPTIVRVHPPAAGAPKRRGRQLLDVPAAA